MQMCKTDALLYESLRPQKTDWKKERGNLSSTGFTIPTPARVPASGSDWLTRSLGAQMDRGYGAARRQLLMERKNRSVDALMAEDCRQSHLPSSAMIPPPSSPKAAQTVSVVFDIDRLDGFSTVPRGR
uniref:Uncharacterized protein n=1 Tax=Plectus sambesii TaxID=2011161 RepID=A0A914VBN0_9BILA